MATPTAAGVYRPRRPERTVLYQVLSQHFERYLVLYGERFGRTHGSLRAATREAVYRYLDWSCPGLVDTYGRVRAEEVHHAKKEAVSAGVSAADGRAGEGGQEAVRAATTSVSSCGRTGPSGSCSRTRRTARWSSPSPSGFHRRGPRPPARAEPAARPLLRLLLERLAGQAPSCRQRRVRAGGR